MNDKVETIYHMSDVLAIIIYSDYSNEGIIFYTPPEFSQQLAYMNRPAGYQIEPHIHKYVVRKVHNIQETLLIKKGKVKIDFYSPGKKYITHRVLKTGDVILLASGGHGLIMMEQTEIIEVKQGPYAGDDDKVRFKEIAAPTDCDK